MILFGSHREFSPFKPLMVGARSALRFARFANTLAVGTALIEGAYRTPFLGDMRHQHLPDTAWFPYWAEEVGRSVNIKLHIYGEPCAETCLYVSNHISWIDVVTVSLCSPLSFIAKDDVKTWPWAGNFTQRMRTVYIDRSNKFQAYRSLPNIEERLKEGRNVLVFPEGTTTLGKDVLEFKPMFYEAAVRAQKPVQAMVVKYTDSMGHPLPEVSYSNDDGFFETLFRVFKIDKVHAHVSFLEPMDPSQLDRKQMAHQSEKQVRARLQEDMQTPFP